MGTGAGAGTERRMRDFFFGPLAPPSPVTAARSHRLAQTRIRSPPKPSMEVAGPAGASGRVYGEEKRRESEECGCGREWPLALLAARRPVPHPPRPLLPFTDGHWRVSGEAIAGQVGEERWFRTRARPLLAPRGVSGERHGESGGREKQRPHTCRPPGPPAATGQSPAQLAPFHAQTCA